MTLLAPGWLIVAAVASLGVAALHLIAWRTPRRELLPTARFVPDDPARRAARTIQLSDLALLALRVGILLLAGLALARPVMDTSRGGSALVVAVDATLDTAALAGVFAGLPRADRTAFVVFDTTASVSADTGAARSAAARLSGYQSSLTVGLLAATRQARRFEREVESVRLVLVSPLAAASFDGATHRVRDLWRDSLSVIRVPRRAGPAPGPVFLPDEDTDPVVAGARLAAANGLLAGPITLVRDTIVAPAAPAVVAWPRREEGEPRVDGVMAGSTTAVGHFIRFPDAGDGRVVARWIDGAPAAREVLRAGGCLRRVLFDVPDEGDFTLSPAFQRLLAVLLQPCAGEAVAYETIPDSAVHALSSAPTRGASVVATASATQANHLAAALMVLALVTALLEWMVRRRTGSTLLAEPTA